MAVRPAHSRRRRIRGMTLSELMVSIAISAIVLAGAMGVFVGVMRSTRGAVETADQNARTRFVQEQFLYDLRAVTEVVTMESDQIVVSLKDHAHEGEIRRVSFWHDPVAGALMRTDLDSGQRRIVVSGLQSVRFSYFKRGINKVAAARTADVNAIQVELLPQARSGLLTGRNQNYVTTLVQLRNPS